MPFEGEFGWDYETDVIYQKGYNQFKKKLGQVLFLDILIVRACLPPHALRFYQLNDVDGTCPPPFKELTIEAEEFWESL